MKTAAAKKRDVLKEDVMQKEKEREGFGA